MQGKVAGTWWLTMVATLLSPIPARGQLVITAAPVPSQVRPGTALVFSGAVLQSQTPLMYVRVMNCTVTYSGPYKNSPFPVCLRLSWVSEAVTVDYVPYPAKVSVGFSDTFIVPATAQPGDSLCFSFEESQHKNYGFDKRDLPTCRIVTATPLTPHRGPVAAIQPARRGGTRSRDSTVERVAKPAPAGTRPAVTTRRGSVRAARAGPVPPGARTPPRADLLITFEKAPWAKWIIRNDGQRASAPTQFVLSRAAVPDKVIQVPALAGGATHEVLVTPALDIYLVNAWAVIDPKNFVSESDETNNGWKSVDSR